MNKINNLNPIDILKYIIRHNKINPVTFTIMITGKIGPTGKTWLCNELCSKGYRAMEMSPQFHSLMLNDDGINHVVVDDGEKQAIVVLNEILPMYWGKGFRAPEFDPNDFYTFKTRAEAEKILDQMRQITEMYHVVTKADFIELIDEEITDLNEHKYGWTSDMIKKARVVPNKYGFYIEFPRSVLIV